jgi:hypothetical protein
VPVPTSRIRCGFLRGGRYRFPSRSMSMISWWISSLPSALLAQVEQASVFHAPVLLLLFAGLARDYYSGFCNTSSVGIRFLSTPKYA